MANKTDQIGRAGSLSRQQRALPGQREDTAAGSVCAAPGARSPAARLCAGAKSLCKGGDSPQQGRVHSGKAPEAGPLRTVPAVVA